METEIANHAINAAPALIGSVQTWMQFGVFVLLLIALAAFMWIREGSATAKRTAARDTQIQELKTNLEEVKRTAEGVGKSLDTHVNVDHNKWENRIDAKFESMESEIKFIKENLILRAEFLKFLDMVHSIDKRLAVITMNTFYDDEFNSLERHKHKTQTRGG